MAQDGREYWIWLSMVDGVGPVRMRRLMNAYDHPRAVYEQARRGELPAVDPAAGAKIREAARPERVEKALRVLESGDIGVVCQCDPQYPQPLLGIYDPPFVLYTRGRIELLRSRRMISMVGTRQPTRSGQQAALMLARGLAGSGVTLVSGLARGIDGLCHQGCLEAGGDTIAVLGCGVDVVYPRENRELYDQIVRRGLILSEYPPGMPPIAGNFPARNRIISGLSSGVVVVEAAQRSGTLFTVDYAIDQSRDIFAVPGPITSAMSATPNNLIKSGAQVAASPEDILEYYGWSRRSGEDGGTPRIRPTNREEAAVLELLEDGEMTFDQIYEQTDYTVPQLAAILSMMELKGMVTQLPGRVYSL